MKVPKTFPVLLSLSMAAALFSCSVDLQKAEESCPQSKSYCFTVGYSQESTGDGSIKSCSTASGTYVEGTKIVVAAAPCKESKSYFTGWYDAPCGGKLVSTEETYRFKLSGNTALYARFDWGGKGYYNFTVGYWAKSTTDGDVRKSTPSGKYVQGTEITVVAEPCLAQNAYFAGWYDAPDGGAPVSREAIYKFKLNGDRALYARFVKGDFTPPDNSSDIVTFPDLNLEEAIRKKLRKPAGPLTKQELAGILTLNLTPLFGNRPISDLTGIKYLKNLRHINLENSSLNDFSHLFHLTKLQYLNLNNTGVEDISFLKVMPNIDDLRLNDNNISDITPITELIKIDWLKLNNNRISDISPLRKLHKLRSLYLANNQIDDISPLRELTILKFIELNDNKITDISVLKALPWLYNLDLSNNMISDLSPLANKGKLPFLYLSNNRISDIGPLKNLKHFAYLHLDGNRISDISPLSGKLDISILHLENNLIEDLSPLKTLIGNKELYLSQNKIEDITPLANLISSYIIDLSHNKISDITTLVNNPRIKSSNTVHLKGNSNIPQEQINALKAKGVTVL